MDKNVRNKNVDICRAFAVCIIIVYHIWVLTGQTEIKNNVLRTFIMLGGEIGVTAFFVISGFGIYFSLKGMEQSGGIKFSSFLKRRAVRIMPEYYISILFLLFLSNAAVYLSRQGLKDIMLHLVFIHNICPGTSGTINGVLWTMAVIVQFYVIAIPLYKLCERFHVVFCGIAILFTVGCKYVLLHYMLPIYVGGGVAFWLSRQLLPAVIDNFVMGMFIAQLVCGKQDKRKIWCGLYILGAMIALILLYIVCVSGLRNGIHTDNISGFTWHSVVGLCIALMIYCFSMLKLPHENFIYNFFLWLAQYEYGIYIIHLVLIQSIVSYSPAIQYCNSYYPWISYVALFVASIIIGYIYSLLINVFRKEYILRHCQRTEGDKKNDASKERSSSGSQFKEIV